MKPIQQIVAILVLSTVAWANPVLVSGNNAVRTLPGISKGSPQINRSGLNNEVTQR